MERQKQTEIIRKYFTNDYGYRYKENRTGLPDLWNTLIKRVADLCDCYRSDLVYDIRTVLKLLDEQENFSYLFGLRECGVDSFSFIVHRLNQHCYREIWRLDVDFKPDDYSDNNIKCEFYKIHEPNDKATLDKIAYEVISDENE